MILKWFSASSTKTKHAIAAMSTLLALGSLAAICFVIYQILQRVDIVTILENIVFGIIVLFSILVCLIVFACLHFHFYEKLFGKENQLGSNSSSVESSWISNSGEKPSCNRVNVEYKDKTISWNVNPSSLDWSFNTTNPICTYLPK